MAQVIKVKQSSVAGKVPTTTQLQLGELALNTTDGKLYFLSGRSGSSQVWRAEADGTVMVGGSTRMPGVRKAVKWNSPLYAADDDGWFLSLHCFTGYIKVAFFRGTALKPVPPEPSRSADTRYLHIAQDGVLDEARFLDWVRQAAALPGEHM